MAKALRLIHRSVYISSGIKLRLMLQRFGTGSLVRYNRRGRKLNVVFLERKSVVGMKSSILIQTKRS